MFCSTNCLIERCHLLYIFIAVAVLLLLFCIYLYRRHSTRMRDENEKIGTEEIMNKEPIEVSVEELPEILESADGEPELITKPFKNVEETQNVKENDNKPDDDVIIETVDESNGEITETTIKE